MKKFSLRIKFTLVILFVLNGFISYAQTAKRVFTFEAGDEFQKQIFLNSTCIIERGEQRLDVSSSSSINKNYKILEAAEKGYRMSVSIPKMDVVINALGQEMHYNSEQQIDTTSLIEKALKTMVDKPDMLWINDNGVILSADDPSFRLASDSLLTFAGIEAETFIEGDQFNLTPDFTISKNLKIGYSWRDSVTIAGQKMKSEFWIDNLTPENTVIKFKSSVTGNSLNSNSNGTYIIDNKSGILIQKLLQSISTGYQVRNSVVYATTRRIAISEDCIKKEQ